MPDDKEKTSSNNGDSRISQRQIAIVSGLITGIAGAVAAFLVVLYNDRIDDYNTIHEAELTRTISQVERLQDREEELLERSERQCTSRINEMKEASSHIRPALERCLERPVDVNVVCQYE